jgi:predicted RNA-binding Zn-ribbon protein involved in translation (DUF1610 family)
MKICVHSKFSRWNAYQMYCIDCGTYLSIKSAKCNTCGEDVFYNDEMYSYPNKDVYWCPKCRNYVTDVTVNIQ